MIQLSYNSDELNWRSTPCYQDLWCSPKTAPLPIHLRLRKNCDEGARQTCIQFIDWLAYYAPVSLHDEVVADLFEDKTYTFTYVTLQTEPTGNAYLYYTVLSLCRFLTPEYNQYLIKRAEPRKIFERVFAKRLIHPLGLHLPAEDHFYFDRMAKQNLPYVFDFYSYKLSHMPFSAFNTEDYCRSGITSRDFHQWLSKNVTINANVTEKEQDNA